MAFYMFFVQPSEAVNSGSILKFFLWTSKPTSDTGKLRSEQIEKFDRADEKAACPPSPTSVWSRSSSARSSSFNDSETDSSSVSSWDASSVDENASVGQSERTAAESEHDAAVPDMAEIKVVFDRFDENCDGLICAKDLVKFAERLGYKMSLTEAKDLVESADSNKDGKLDFAEFYSLYKSLGGCPELSRLTGQSGRADEEDENTLREAFAVYDTDNNGYICAKELQAVLRNMGLPEGKSLKRCERVIRRVAANAEYGITLREFKSMMCCKAASATQLKGSKSFF